MLIVCPNCKKRFDIDTRKAEEAKKLRCSSCTAVFRLRRRQQDETPAAAPAPRPAAGEGAAGRLKVVIANESAAFCEAVRKVLSTEPFDVTVCNDGRVALETVETLRPGLLLLDVALPTMFGFEVCERVRQNPELAGVKIVLIASIYDKTRYKRSPNSLYGADDYIEKHHIPDSLVPMIYRLTSSDLPEVAFPTERELAEQAETRSELREAEVRETTGISPASEAPGQSQSPAAADFADPWAEVQDSFDSAPAAAAPAGAPVRESSLPEEAAPLEEISPFDEAAPFEEISPFDEAAPPEEVSPVEPASVSAPAELSEAEVKARRLARIIVSDIVLYNQAKVEQGVREGSFYALLADDIREGDRLYRQRVSEEVRESTSFLKDAFENLIAKKRAELRI